MKTINDITKLGSVLVCSGFLFTVPAISKADQVILDDLIVDGSICAGGDCANGESFGFDTLRLKENNLRIRAYDTSSSASFPSRDWQITFNDSGNGGQNKFSIDDIDGNRTPFTIEAGAGSHSLYVDDGGRIGLGTSTPVVELHVVDGDSPTLRLEQDGSSGFTPQTWDVAGNETNFFVRDATNGSTLPFRIKPGAPSNSLFIEADGDVGFGTQSPATDAAYHIENTAGDDVDDFVVTNDGNLGIGTTAPTRDVDIVRSGDVNFSLKNSTSGAEWILQNYLDNFRVTRAGTGVGELTLDASGNLTIVGNFISGATTLNVPDYVLKQDYPLMPLHKVSLFIKEKGHLPNIPSEKEIKKSGLDISKMQMRLLEKIEELTLYTLQQDQEIKSLKATVSAMKRSL